jgi:hypothetical protein
MFLENRFCLGSSGQGRTGMSPADAKCVQFSGSQPSTRHIIVRPQLEASVGDRTADETIFGAEDAVMSSKSAKTSSRAGTLAREGRGGLGAP